MNIQEEIMSDEYKASSIIYEKYRRKFHLKRRELIRIYNHVKAFSRDRASMGKSVNKDAFVQEASKYFKENMKDKFFDKPSKQDLESLEKIFKSHEDNNLNESRIETVVYYRGDDDTHWACHYTDGKVKESLIRQVIPIDNIGNEYRLA